MWKTKRYLHDWKLICAIHLYHSISSYPMDSTDKLIEYYFQQKIAGMSLVSIRESLQVQMFEEDLCELIINQVLRREQLYHKALKSRNLSFIFRTISILSLSAAMIILIISVAYRAIPSSTILIISLLFATAISAIISIFLIQRAQKPVFHF